MPSAIMSKMKTWFIQMTLRIVDDELTMKNEEEKYNSFMLFKKRAGSF